jgi:hypothetical protein
MIPMKKRKPRAARERISSAYIAYSIPRLLDLANKLHYKLDPAVARTAIRVLGSEVSAARWLTRPLEVLGGKAPVDGKKKDVLQVLGRLERGVFN